MNSEYIPTWVEYLCIWLGICGIRGLNKKIRVNNDQKKYGIITFLFCEWGNPNNILHILDIPIPFSVEFFTRKKAKNSKNSKKKKNLIFYPILLCIILVYHI